MAALQPIKWTVGANQIPDNKYLNYKYLLLHSVSRSYAIRIQELCLLQYASLQFLT